MRQDESKKIILIAKEVASEWVTKISNAEYKIYVYPSKVTGVSFDVLVFLRRFRDGMFIPKGLMPISDLGVLNNSDQIIVWSKDKEKLQALAAFLIRNGFEIYHPDFF